MSMILREIQPVSVYEGTVYTQDVFLELPCGLKLRVSDARKRCDESMTDQHVAVEIKADNIQESEQVEKGEYKIKQSDKSCSLDLLRGKIDEIVEDTPQKYTLAVDAGCVSIECHIHKNDGPKFSPKVNDWIEFREIYGLYLQNIEISNEKT